MQIRWAAVSFSKPPVFSLKSSVPFAGLKLEKVKLAMKLWSF